MNPSNSLWYLENSKTQIKYTMLLKQLDEGIKKSEKLPLENRKLLTHHD